LGVPGVPVYVYRTWVAGMRQRLLPGTGTDYNEETPEAVLRVKKHPALLALLEARASAPVDAVEATLKEELCRLDGGAPGVARFRDRAARPIVSRLRRLLGWLDKPTLPPLPHAPA